MRSSLSSAFYWGGKVLGAKPLGTRILCYHRVRDRKGDYLSVSPSEFRRQMNFLASEGYRSISLQELLGGMRDEKSIVITFDDGYRDNYEAALTILKELGFRASVFCIASKIGKPDYLTRDQVCELNRAGWEIGSHTLSHPDLKKLDSEQKWNEISGSKKSLEASLGIDLNFFCYPFGLYDEEAVALVEKAGYLGACSNLPGANRSLEPYLLKRTEIAGSDSLDDFKKKIAGAFDLLHQGLHLIRGKP